MALAIGSVYKIQTRLSAPGHFFVVLSGPDLDGRYLFASLTDARHVPYNTDKWKPFTSVGDYVLAKTSAVAVQYLELETEQWLEVRSQVSAGVASKDVVTRLRCNLLWFQSYLKPIIRRHWQLHRAEWDQECGPRP